MLQYRFLEQLTDTDVQEYVAAVTDELVANYGRNADIVCAAVEANIPFLKELFLKYPETICHDDPTTFAERLAIRWGWVDDYQLSLA
jgi:hypothetical protein